MKYNLKSEFLIRKRLRNLPTSYREIFYKVKSELKEDIQPCEERERTLHELLDMLETAVQNNVSITELLAEGYDTFYNDLVLSLPSYTGEVRRSKTHKRRLTVGFLMVFLLAFVTATVAYAGGWLGVSTQGIGYISGNLNRYSYSTTNLEDRIEFTVDLKEPSANIGKIIYQNDDCYIEIHDIQRNGDNCAIYFRSHGTYSYRKAALISGVKHHSTESRYFTYTCVASLQTRSGDILYDCGVAGMSGINYDDGDMFGFYIFSEEYFRNENIEGAEDVDYAVLVLSNLVKNEWQMK